jgi:lysophospholipid acyltransferase (LPLAT)-like uncharacterized protein
VLLVRRALGTALGCLVWVWVRTLSVVVESSGTAVASRRVFAFFHGQQMALLAAGRTSVAAVLVSHSRDGDIQAAVMESLGFRIARGSSSRGGRSGLMRIVRLVRSGLDSAFAVDGPRGPVRVPKPGAARAARLAGAALVPVASACARKIVLRRTWDAFEIPLPFSRVAIVIASPIAPFEAERTPEILGAALAVARARAEFLVKARDIASKAEAPCRLVSR